MKAFRSKIHFRFLLAIALGLPLFVRCGSNASNDPICSQAIIDKWNAFSTAYEAFKASTAVPAEEWYEELVEMEEANRLKDLANGLQYSIDGESTYCRVNAEAESTVGSQAGSAWYELYRFRSQHY